MAKRKTDINELLDRSRRWHKTQVKWRRHLHQYPEIANQELRTTAFLKKELRGFGLRILPLKMKTGVLAELKGKNIKKNGRTVALRSDIDALPITEQSGLPYASKIRGRMHACGHDVHMATVLGAAALLSELRDQINGTIRFIFQPAEEAPPGGAKFMIEEGAMNGVDTIFGLHVDPHLPTGIVGLCDGPMMAMVLDFDLFINGLGGHAARPQFAVDAVTTAAEVVTALQKIASRSADPATPFVLTVGQIEGGTARNVIADRVKLVCTARTLSLPFGKKIMALVRRTVGGVCKTYGASFEVVEHSSYPILVNDATTNARYASVFEAMFGRMKTRVAEPVLGGEDFAFYAQMVPGAMFRLGIRNKSIGADKPWHSSKFIVDEEAIYFGTALLAGSTLSYLDEHSR